MNNEVFLLKTIFSEIIRGYSFSHDFSLYIKHNTSYDSFESEQVYQTSYNIAKDSKLPTDEEKLKYLADNNLWTEKDEILIKDKNLFLNGLKTSKTKSLLSRERDYFTKEIEKTEKEISALEDKKQNLLGLTCENFANRKCNENAIIKSLYKDSKLETSFFNEQEIEYLEDQTIQNIYKSYIEILAKFTEKNIKKVSVSPFFLNPFYLCDNNPQTFYGKPIIQLTFYQINLFSNGCHFKNILSEMRDKITPEMLNDPEKLVSMYETNKSMEDIQKSKINSKFNNEEMTKTIVGASKEDKKILGEHPGLDMGTELRKSGKEKMSMKDIIKFHGL